MPFLSSTAAKAWLNVRITAIMHRERDRHSLGLLLIVCLLAKVGVERAFRAVENTTTARSSHTHGSSVVAGTGEAARLFREPLPPRLSPQGVAAAADREVVEGDDEAEGDGGATDDDGATAGLFEPRALRGAIGAALPGAAAPPPVALYTDEGDDGADNLRLRFKGVADGFNDLAAAEAARPRPAVGPS